MDDNELAKRAHALPGRFAGRLDPADLATAHGYAEAGEWGEEIDLLVACLALTQQPVTPAEREEFQILLRAMGLPSEPVGRLHVAGP